MESKTNDKNIHFAHENTKGKPNHSKIPGASTKFRVTRTRIRMGRMIVSFGAPMPSNEDEASQKSLDCYSLRLGLKACLKSAFFKSLVLTLLSFLYRRFVNLNWSNQTSKSISFPFVNPVRDALVNEGIMPIFIG